MSEIPSRRTATLGIWLRLETLPTHMETELASLALLSKGTFATVEGVTNGFVLWCHLVAAFGQCLLFGILVELIAHFSKTFAFGLVACIRLDTRQRWGISFGDLHPRDQTKLHLGMIHALVEGHLHGLRSIRALGQSSLRPLGKLPEQHLICLANLANGDGERIGNTLTM